MNQVLYYRNNLIIKWLHAKEISVENYSFVSRL